MALARRLSGAGFGLNNIECDDDGHKITEKYDLSDICRDKWWSIGPERSDRL